MSSTSGGDGWRWKRSHVKRVQLSLVSSCVTSCASRLFNYRGRRLTCRCIGLTEIVANNRERKMAGEPTLFCWCHVVITTRCYTALSHTTSTLHLHCSSPASKRLWFSPSPGCSHEFHSHSPPEASASKARWHPTRISSPFYYSFITRRRCRGCTAESHDS